MLFFNEQMETEKNIAIISTSGEHYSYIRLCAEAKNMECYGQGRKLTAVVCDKAGATIAFVFKLFYLGQPMIFLSENSSEEYLKAVQKQMKPAYMWRNGELQVCEKDDEMLEEEIHEDIAVLISTSGSLGSPKFVKISYKNLRETGRMPLEQFGIKREQKGILTLPIDHIWGLNFCLYHWFSKATLLVSEYTVMDKKFAELYDAYKVNNITGIPFTYNVLKKIDFWEKERIERLNCAMVAGGKLDEKLRKATVSLLKEKFFLCYGQTEVTGAIYAINFDDIFDVREGILGKPMNGIRAHICDGELVIRGDIVCGGYAINSEELYVMNSNLQEVYTGDMVETDEQQNIYFIGRKKRFVKIMGHRYQLDNIEELLKARMNTRLGIVCMGEEDKIIVCVESEQLEAERIKCIKDILIQHLDITQRMISVYNVKQFPQSSAGKILYSKLYDMFMN